VWAYQPGQTSRGAVARTDWRAAPLTLTTKRWRSPVFVAIARFPEVPSELEDEFQAWFAWSNNQLRQVDGLTGRRLLGAADGAYIALVEHTSGETFAAMHDTEVASRVHARGHHGAAAGAPATVPVSGTCCQGA
jgi:hypothetical protein